MLQNSLEALVKEKPLLGVPFTVKESCQLEGKIQFIFVFDSQRKKDGCFFFRLKLDYQKTDVSLNSLTTAVWLRG